MSMTEPRFLRAQGGATEQQHDADEPEEGGAGEGDEQAEDAQEHGGPGALDPDEGL